MRTAKINRALNPLLEGLAKQIDMMERAEQPPKGSTWILDTFTVEELRMVELFVRSFDHFEFAKINADA